MAFWSETITADPKRQHRWMVSMGAAGISGQIQWIAKKVTKPKITVSSAEHKFLNHTFYYPGNVTYDPITLTLVDPANPHSSEAMFLLLQDSGYVLPDQITDAINVGNPSMASTVSKRSGVSAMSGMKITQMDGDGTAIEVITLQNPWLESVDFGGELSYESDGLVEIALTIRFDFFKLDVGAAAVTAAGI